MKIINDSFWYFGDYFDDNIVVLAIVCADSIKIDSNAIEFVISKNNNIYNYKTPPIDQLLRIFFPIYKTEEDENQIRYIVSKLQIESSEAVTSFSEFNKNPNNPNHIKVRITQCTSDLISNIIPSIEIASEYRKVNDGTYKLITSTLRFVAKKIYKERAWIEEFEKQYYFYIPDGKVPMPIYNEERLIECGSLIDITFKFNSREVFNDFLLTFCGLITFSVNMLDQTVLFSNFQIRDLRINEEEDSIYCFTISAIGHYYLTRIEATCFILERTVEYVVFTEGRNSSLAGLFR